MQAPILIDGVKRLGVGFEPPSQLRQFAGGEVLPHLRFVAERATDAARALHQQTRRDLERPPALVDRACPLRRSQLSEATIPRVEAQRSQ
jgi:hypothetical protein